MSFLLNRQQFVVCDGTSSDMGRVVAGIPQGSVLGPLLFLLYINCIFSLKLNGFIQLYADDMAIVYGESQHHVLKGKMIDDLDILVPWLAKINFTINFAKTKFIIFRSSRSNSNNIFHCLHYGPNTIYSTTDYDYLGLTVDEWLNWSCHISKVSRRISFFVYQMKRIRHAMPFNVLKMIYFAHINSLLTYLLPVWGSALKTHSRCLQVLQSKAIKYMRFLPYDTPTSSLFNNSSPFLSFHQLYNYESMFLIHKMHLKLIKCNVPFLTNYSITGINTRSASLLRMPR